MFKTKEFTLTNKLLVFFIFLLSLFGFLFISLQSINLANAETSLNTELEVKIHDILALSLENCDSSNSSVLKISIQPTPTGAFKSNCQIVTVNTNAPGYNLSVKSSDTNLIYQNPTTLQSLPIIPSTSSTIASTPAALDNDKWGFAVAGSTDLGFDATYSPDNASNKFAELPTTDTIIYSTDQWPITKPSNTFYYGTKLTTNTVAGTYATTITYTAIGAEIPPVAGTPYIGYKDNINDALVSIYFDTRSTDRQYSLDDGTSWLNYATPFTLNETTLVKARQTIDSISNEEERWVYTGSVYAADYGVVCDGVTDDRNALISALTTAPTGKYNIVFPEKEECLINNTVEIFDWTNHKLVGNGTTLFMNDNFLGGNNEFWFVFKRANNSTIDNLVFDARQTNALTNGGTVFKTQLAFHFSNNVTVTNNFFNIPAGSYRYHAWNNLDIYTGNNNILIEKNKFINDVDAVQNSTGGSDVGSNLAIREIQGSNTSNITVRNNDFHKIGHDEIVYVFGGNSSGNGSTKNVFISDNKISMPAGESNNSVQCIAFFGNGSMETLQNVHFNNNDVSCSASQTLITLRDINGLSVKDNYLEWNNLTDIANGYTLMQHTLNTGYQDIVFSGNRIVTNGESVTQFASIAAEYLDNTITINTDISSTGTVFAAGNTTIIGNDVTVNGNTRSLVANAPIVKDNNFHVTGTITSFVYRQGSAANSDIIYSGNTVTTDTGNNTNYNSLITLQFSNINGYTIYVTDNIFNVKANVSYSMNTLRWQDLVSPANVVFSGNTYGSYPRNSSAGTGSIAPSITFE